MTPILLYLDRILVASLISLEAMTFYVIPYEVITRLRIVPASLVNALFPSLSERSKAPSSESMAWLYCESLKYMVLILLPCFLVLGFMGPDILVAWVGPEYASRGGQVLRIMAGGALLNSLSYVPYAALLALGRPDLPAKFHLAELPLYVGLSVLFIPRWGIAGAAWAVTIRLAADAVALFWATSQNLRRASALQTFGRLLILNLLLGFVLILIRRWPATASAQLAGVTACLVCYALGAWFLVLEKRERPLLLRVLQARGRPV
jgi:O-antigen/teichoic acid export membrane protein